MNVAVAVFITASVLGSAGVEEKTKEITLLIEKFDDESFSVRQRAYEKLVKIVQEDENRILLSFFKKIAAHKNPEVACRIQAAAEHYYIVMPDNYYNVPWIDMLPINIPDKNNIVEKYLNKTPEFIGWNNRDYPRYRYATMLYVCDLIDSGMPRSKIVQLLNTMVENEKRWKKEHDYQ